MDASELFDVMRQLVTDWQTCRKLRQMNAAHAATFRGELQRNIDDPSRGDDGFAGERLAECNRLVVMFGERALKIRELIIEAVDQLAELLGDNAPRSLRRFGIHLQPHGNEDEALALWPDVQVDVAMNGKTVADPNSSSNPSKAKKKKLGRQNTEKRDVELAEEYTNGLEEGAWDSKAAFSRHKGMGPSAMSKAIKRGEAVIEKRELNRGTV